MAKHDEFKNSVGAAASKLLCMDAEIEKLTSLQLNALHLCKHEMAAAVHRLYTEVSPKIADPLLKKYFGEIVD